MNVIVVAILCLLVLVTLVIIFSKETSSSAEAMKDVKKDAFDKFGGDQCEVIGMGRKCFESGSGDDTYKHLANEYTCDKGTCYSKREP